MNKQQFIKLLKTDTDNDTAKSIIKVVEKHSYIIDALSQLGDKEWVYLLTLYPDELKEYANMCYVFDKMDIYYIEILLIAQFKILEYIIETDNLHKIKSYQWVNLMIADSRYIDYAIKYNVFKNINKNIFDKLRQQKPNAIKRYYNEWKKPNAKLIEQLTNAGADWYALSFFEDCISIDDIKENMTLEKLKLIVMNELNKNNIPDNLKWIRKII